MGSHRHSARRRSVHPAVLTAAGGLLTTMLVGVAQPPASADDTQSASAVQALFDANMSDGTNGYYLREVDGPVHASSNAGFGFEPSSSLKALVFAHAMRQIDLGPRELTDPLTNPWAGDTGDSCPTDDSAPADDTLATGLTLMMQNSDNGWTETLRALFGDPGPADPNDLGPINQAGVDLGMTNTLLTRRMGCGSAGVDGQGNAFTGITDDPNRTTLVDMGLLWEQMANGYLADFEDARTMVETGDAPFDTIIDSEAALLGLSSQGVADFKSAQISARKAGGDDAGGLSWRSIAGWAEVPFKDGACADDPRQFVHGIFMHRSTTTIGLDPRTPLAELMRERFRAALRTWVACEADLEMSSTSFVNAPTTIDVNTPTDLTVRHTFVNNGPADSIGVVVDAQVSVPPDCTAVPATYQVQQAAPEDAVQVVDRTVTVTCTQPSSHEISVDASISPALSNAIDPVASNNDAGDTIEPAVIAYADLAVADVDVSELSNAGLGDLLVGTPFDFTAPVTIANNGDTLLGNYDDSVTGVLTRELHVPAGVTGSITVAGSEAPATVTIQHDGQAPTLEANQPAGTTWSVAGPATLTVQSFQDLDSGATRQVDAQFSVTCDVPGTADITLVAAIEPEDPHVLDPEAGNDTVAHQVGIECVTPVAINIRPGNAKNQANTSSNQTIPVAVLTTEADEYGLPSEFDATTIDVGTVRFGTTGTLAAGDGSTPWPMKLFEGDWHELDESTKDGDTDARVLVGISGSGISSSDTEACLTGSYSPDGVNSYTFYGCDTVDVTR